MDTRTQFAETTAALLNERTDTALVYAEISGQYFGDTARAHPERVINVGIREQLLVGAGAGLALSGIRPIVHTFSSFLVERAFEQIKLDFLHQGVGGVLVGTGGSFDMAVGGRTHQSPGDVALLDTLPDLTIHAPGTAQEVAASLRQAVEDDGLHYIRIESRTNAASFPPRAALHHVRSGAGPVIVAFGPTLDDVLVAAREVDATVLYTNRVRPFDAAALRQHMGTATDVVIVEPWLEGTSAHVVSAALVDRPHRQLSIGVQRPELRRYGTPEDHRRAHGLDAVGIGSRIRTFLARHTASAQHPVA